MAATAGGTLLGCGSRETESASTDVTETPYPIAVASWQTDADRATSVQRVVELLGGMPWIRPGDHVLLKPSINSPNPYPFTSSPLSCAALVQLCLDAGAGKVTVADCMGIEQTLIPGLWYLEDPWGKLYYGDDDATVLAMRATGLYDGVVDWVGAGDVGAGRRVDITSFRALGWRRWESEDDTPGGRGNATLYSRWVKSQARNGISWEGNWERRPYLPRAFDFWRRDVPGMYLPRLFDEVDHVINVHRASTHVWSHATHAIKNWIGIMRPDDRIWMHQLNYLRSQRFAPDDPASNECPYHEMLAELHLPSWERERLIIADAEQVTVSGGPDETPDPTYPAQLMVGATDLVSADVMAIALVKMGVLASIAEGGLDATCLPQPGNMVQATFEFITQELPWREGAMRGTDIKLCDPNFSPFDWVAIRRAIELGFGPENASQVSLRFADGAHEVPAAKREFLAREIALPSRFG